MFQVLDPDPATTPHLPLLCIVAHLPRSNFGRSPALGLVRNLEVSVARRHRRACKRVGRERLLVLACISLVRSRFGCSSGLGKGPPSRLNPPPHSRHPGSTSCAVVVSISR